VRAAIGDLCEVRGEGGSVEAEVVGLRGERTLLMPFARTVGLEVGARVVRVAAGARAEVGPALLGRVVDALGRPLDGRPLPRATVARPLHASPESPLVRKPIETPFSTSVRAIDGMLTMAKGQRIGIFAGGGVGKSTLLGMMVREARCDVAVVALV